MNNEKMQESNCDGKQIPEAKEASQGCADCKDCGGVVEKEPLNTKQDSGGELYINKRGVKRRPRRRHYEIDRKFPCLVPGCLRSYGTANGLDLHLKVNHPGWKKGDQGEQVPAINSLLKPALVAAQRAEDGWYDCPIPSCR